MTLHKKILANFIVLVLVNSLFFAIVGSFATRYFFNSYVEQQALIRGQQWYSLAEGYYQRNSTWEGLHSLYSGRPRMGGHMRGMMQQGLIAQERALVLDLNNVVVADSGGTMFGEVFTGPDSAKQPIYYQESVVGFFAMVAQPGTGLISLEDDFRKSLNLALIAGTVGSVLIAFMLALVLTRNLIEPILSLLRGAQALAKRRFKERVEVKGPEEIARLGRAFNDMAENLEVSEKLRKQLVADVAHELRTPLTILRGQLENLQVGNIPMNTESLLILNDEVLRMSRLVNELQDLSLLEAGQLPLELKEQDLAPYLQKLETFLTPEAQDKGLKFMVENQVKSPLAFDGQRLIQILINLITNAFRHTGPGGKVLLKVVEEPNRIIFAVEDSGEGIPKEDQAYVFERFYRGDKARQREKTGGGLGLAIVKGLVEAHGGQIWLESEIGKGTTFYFTLARRL